MAKLTLNTLFPFLFGLCLTINWVLIWALPIMGMGMLWKNCLKTFLLPIYASLESNKVLRNFASTYIYSRPEHADYFVMSVLTILNSIVFLSLVFYWQIKYGHLPTWLLFTYYCSWVGVGGRIMGTAYTVAHKEGHNKGMYKGWFKRNIGNIFENGIGMFFGNVPYNFSHSHVAIHHQFNAGCGDTFYMWDIDRSSLFDFMLYVHRIFMYMSGWSSYKFFLGHQMYSKADALKSGMLQYYSFGLVLMAITRSPSFIYWIYFQPLISMGFFLAMINVGYHGFIEFDQLGKSIPVVNSTALIEGEDDSFGEDDHMAHHYNSGVFYRDLPALQKSKEEEFIRYKASVFRGLSIVELSIFILLGLWDKVAEHYVDYSGKMTKDEIKTMLIARAQRIELEYEQYADFLDDPSLEKRKGLSAQIESKFGGKGVFITKSNSESQFTASSASSDDGYTSNDASHDKSM